MHIISFRSDEPYGQRRFAMSDEAFGELFIEFSTGSVLHPGFTDGFTKQYVEAGIWDFSYLASIY